MKDKYIKIVYRSEPIGKECIILYLTTFDIDAFNKDHKILTKEEKHVIGIHDDLITENYLESLEKRIDSYITTFYRKKLGELKAIVTAEKYKSMLHNAPMYLSGEDFKDLNNCNDVRCNIVYGDINNAKNVYVSDVKGDLINCNKIYYTGGLKNEKEV